MLLDLIGLVSPILTEFEQQLDKAVLTLQHTAPASLQVLRLMVAMDEQGYRTYKNRVRSATITSNPATITAPCHRLRRFRRAWSGRFIMFVPSLMCGRL